MIMKLQKIALELAAINFNRDPLNLNQLMEQYPIADIAQVFAEQLANQTLSEEDIFELVQLMPIARQAALLGYFSEPIREKVVERMPLEALAKVLQVMPHDERADLYAHLDETRQPPLLALLDQQERQDVQQLAAYPQGSVGSIMTTDYATLNADDDVQQAIARLREMANERETIYQAYVIDKQNRLLGTLSLKDLVLAQPTSLVSDIMTKETVFVRADEDQECAAQAISKYDLLAVPVFDDQFRLVGIVTYDDAMDVAEQQADMDFHKVAAVGFTGNLKEASVWLMYKKRVFWLVLLVFGNLFSGAGIAYFEETIQTYVALVFFLPLLIDSGGNAGSQSATLMVRALATGEVVMKDWLSMLVRELGIAALLGATMAIAVSLLGFWRGGSDIAFVVAVTMQIVVIIGCVVGMLLPFILNKFKLDPASASAPLITTIADSIGVIIYFSVATMVLDFPPVT
ncbi:magnesium transporter [Vibrio sp. 2-2(8)]|uniref:magnesium transporter n=1 Tax=Vibrio sp. 2-2(8) TaxID=2591014 RepID=UPI001482C318|nr:magnesium transporter [Vibrio sp. 2-2(8)]